ncbi:hypothetical protein E5D57_003297 [Metarhizium anisopliae]|nr:hypothetical protein E5D57_003297 [Metarhizium anisopliae]
MDICRLLNTQSLPPGRAATVTAAITANDPRDDDYTGATIPQLPPSTLFDTYDDLFAFLRNFHLSNGAAIIQALHPTSPGEVNPATKQLGHHRHSTPYTLRHLNKVASKIEDLQEALGELQPALKTEMDRFIRGALVHSTELRQTMSDLARTKMAEDLRKQRKVGKNSPLQSKEKRP